MKLHALILGTAVVAAMSTPVVTTPIASDIGYRISDFDQREAIDSIFAPWTSKDSPGCAVGVFKDGAIAHARGYGMASLEHDVPITPDSVFYAGSVSKQFTAFAVALAIKQGRLAYEDSVRTYLPELPAYADAIRIRHLLHHTSGLRDYNTLLAIAGHRDDAAWDNRAVLRIAARQRALNFEPGSEYLYSNTGYTLLATIVERATGTPFAVYADEQIFKPLGMTSSHFHTDARRLVRHRALGYGGRRRAWTLDTPINERAGAGGLYTTIPDLQKWDGNFHTAKVGGADLVKQVQTPGTLDGGAPLRYAWGLQLGHYRDVPIVEHAGSLGGYRAHFLRAPSVRTSVAVLCNTAAATPASLVREVVSVALRDRFPGSEACCQAGTVGGFVPGLNPSRGTELWYREFAGVYYSDELDATFRITTDGTTLFLQREIDPSPVRLEPGGPVSVFRVRGTTIRFPTDPGQKVTRFTVEAGRVRGIVFLRK